MRQHSDRGVGSRPSTASGQSDGGGIPGKRTLVEQVYGPAGAAPVQRKASDGDAAAGASDADARFPRVAAIAHNGLGAAALRRALTADPSLAREIPMYLAAGGAPELNDLMAAAFPTVPVTQAERPSTARSARPRSSRARAPSRRSSPPIPASRCPPRAPVTNPSTRAS